MYMCVCVYVNLEIILASNKHTLGSCVHIITMLIQYNMVYM